MLWRMTVERWLMSDWVFPKNESKLRSKFLRLNHDICIGLFIFLKKFSHSNHSLSKHLLGKLSTFWRHTLKHDLKLLTSIISHYNFFLKKEKREKEGKKEGNNFLLSCRQEQIRKTPKNGRKKKSQKMFYSTIFFTRVKSTLFWFQSFFFTFFHFFSHSFFSFSN